MVELGTSTGPQAKSHMCSAGSSYMHMHGNSSPLETSVTIINYK